jgi:putative copper export protein
MSLESVLADAGGATRILVRTLALGGTAVAIGALTFRWVVLRSAVRARIVTRDVDRQVATIGLIAAAVVTIAAPWRILGQADAFMSPGDPLMPVLVTVLKTTWGRAASVQVVAAIVALGGFWAARDMAFRGWRVAFAAATVMAATPAWMGHAAATESRPIIAIGADIIHVAAAGTWAGSVIVLALVLQHLRRQATGGALAAELIARFRTLALGGAGALLITGLTSALFRLTTPGDLFTSAYGVMLSIKLVVVGCAAALGRRHSQTAAARARAGGAQAVAASIGAEALLLVLVVAMSALLSASPPPGD